MNPKYVVTLQQQHDLLMVEGKTLMAFELYLPTFLFIFFFIDLILQSFGLYNTITIWTLICSCKGKK